MLRFWGPLAAFVPLIISLLLGVMKFGAQSAAAQTLSPLTLPANTAVELRLKKSINSEDAKPGHPVEFEVVYDVRVNDRVVIPRGVSANGSIQQIDQSSKGKATLLIDPGTTQTISGEKVRLAGTGTRTSDKLGMKDVGGLAATEPEIIPVLPVAVLMVIFQKKNELLPKGTREEAYTAETVVLDAAKLQASQEQLRETRRVACRQGAKNHPDSVRAHVSAAECLRRNYDWEGANQEYQQALASNPDSSELHFEIALMFRNEKDFDHAIREYRRGVQLKPKDENAREELLKTMEESGDHDGALAELKEAIRIWPNHLYLHYLLGKVLINKNDPDAAIAELQWVLTRERNFPVVNCELGRALELKGDLEAALREYGIAFPNVGDKQCRAAFERLQLQLKK